MRHKVVPISVLIWVFLALAMPTQRASAYWTGQDLTETEWNAWPPYCKAGFLAAGWGHGPFEGRMSRSAIMEASKDNTIPGRHHFCIGLVAINRSAAKRGNEAKHLMKTAASEIHYSYSKMEADNPKFSLVSAYYGKALYGAGEHQKAFEVWRAAIRAAPTERSAYLLMSEALVSEQRLDEALRIVTEFDQAKEQAWPDAEYFLGYLYYKKSKYDEALKHLEEAQKLGYPNNGLLTKVRNQTASRK